MVDCLKYIDAEGLYKGEKTVLVRGDSNLVLSFMTRACKPGKRQLVELVKEARDVIGKWKPTKVAFQHVKREHN